MDWASYGGLVSSHRSRRRSRRSSRQRRARRRIVAFLGLALLVLLAYAPPWHSAPPVLRTPAVVAELPPAAVPAEPVAAEAVAASPVAAEPVTTAPVAAGPASPGPLAAMSFDLPPVEPPPLSPELMPPVLAMQDEVPAELQELRGREMGLEALEVEGGLVSIGPEGGVAGPPAGLRRGEPEAKPLAVAPRPAPSARPAAVPAAGARVAIIIDDLGPAHAWSARAIALPGPLTMSFLPYAEDLGEQTGDARRRGHEIFLHMPMQPLGDANPGKNALRPGMSAADIRERVEWAIDRVGSPVGMNNHMGSRMTADARAMQVVMEVLRGHGLMFVDSRTSPKSVAEGVAAEAGLAHTGRDVFLDHFPGTAFVRHQLAEVEARARRTGSAVAIGHPLPATMEVLEGWIPAAKARGLRFVKVSELIAARGCGGDTAAGKCGLLHVAGQRPGGDDGGRARTSAGGG